MKKLFVIFLIILITSTAIINLLKIQANQLTLKKIYTNQTNFKHYINSDAQFIEYKLFDTKNNIIKTKRLNLNNPNLKITKRYITLPLKKEQEYKLEYILIDDVENKSQTYKQQIQLDKTKPKFQIKNPRICSEKLCVDIIINEKSEIKDLKTQKIFGKFDTKKTLILKNSWQWGKTYFFELQAKDLANNLSQIEKFHIKTPNLEPSGGGIYGADKKNPWGKNNDYKNNPATARLNIKSDVIGGGYSFENISNPKPLLTYNEGYGGNFYIYGSALSKNSKFNVKIYKTYASFNEAVSFCKKKLNFFFFNLYDSRVQNCIKNEMGESSYHKIINSYNKRCGGIFAPYYRYKCYEKEKSQRLTKYFGIYQFHPKHIRVGFFKTNYKEFAHIWQEKNVNFKLKVSEKILKPSELIFAKSVIYGEIHLANQSFNYRNNTGAISLSSNFIRINKPSKNIQTTKCGNYACKILDVKYINQWVNSQGKYESWNGWYKKAGGHACGPTSCAMILNFFKKLPWSSPRLKSFIFQDNGQNLKFKKCNRPGAFAVTAFQQKCIQSSLSGLFNYLKQYNIKTRSFWASRSSYKKSINQIKKAIDKGHPLILSYKKPIGHILVIKGYTYSNQLIVHDPYRDIQNNYIRGKYDYSGQNAIYSLYPNSKFIVNYIIEVG